MENLMGRYRNITILGAVIILQILGLAIQIKRRTQNDSSRLIRVWAVGAVTPLEKTFVSLQNGATNLWHNYFYLRGVRQENRALQQQIQEMQLEQVRLRQDAEQARRLQALLGFKEQFIDKTVAAQVIGSSGSEQSRIVYLDKGSAEGLGQDMAVISAEGVIGKVIQTFRHTSQVLLINDQNSGVGTLFEQSRLQGVLKGTANGEIVLDNIMSDEDVKPGERVLTSGGDQIFPKGLPVGTVSKVTKGKEFLLVTIKPAAALTHLEEVLVITKKEQREPAVASGTPLRAADVLAERLPSVPDQPAQPPAGSTPAGPSTGSPKPVVPAAAIPRTPATPLSSTATPGTVTKKPVADGSSAVNTQFGAAPGTPKAQPHTTSQPGISATPLNSSQSSPEATQVKTTKPAAVPAKSPSSGNGTLPASKPGATAKQQSKSPKPETNTISQPAGETTQPAAQPDSGGTPQ